MTYRVLIKYPGGSYKGQDCLGMYGALHWLESHQYDDQIESVSIQKIHYESPELHKVTE